MPDTDTVHRGLHRTDGTGRVRRPDRQKRRSPTQPESDAVPTADRPRGQPGTNADGYSGHHVLTVPARLVQLTPSPRPSPSLPTQGWCSPGAEDGRTRPWCIWYTGENGAELARIVGAKTCGALSDMPRISTPARRGRRRVVGDSSTSSGLTVPVVRQYRNR